MLNTLFVPPYTGSVMSSYDGRKKKLYMNLYNKITEFNAIINMVASDIVGKAHFEPFESNSGRNKILDAEHFALNNQLTEVELSQIIDILVTGEGYAWYTGIDTAQLKTVLDNSFKRKFGLKSSESKEYSDKAFLKLLEFKGKYLDEDYLKPRKLLYMASSTVDNIHDMHDIISYVQSVNGITKEFKPSEILHLTFAKVDGKITGFTPTPTLIPQLELLDMMWRNQKSLQANGVSGSKIFNFENLHVGSNEYQRIHEQLTQYRSIENKHGHMLMTNKLNVIDLDNPESMHFKEVGLYVIGVLAMHWNIPKGRIPMIIGGTNTKSEVGGGAERSYWMNVERMQDRFLSLWNTQFWIPKFGVKRVFDKDYKQDEVAEQTALQLKLNNLKFMNELYRSVDKQLSKDKLMLMLGHNDKDLMPAKEPELFGQGTTPGFGKTRQNMVDQGTVNDETDNSAKKDQKRKEQTSNTLNRGKHLGV